MRVLHAAQLTFPADWRIAKHSHEKFTEIIIPIGGVMETEIGGQTIVGKPGRVMMYPRRVPHAERSISRQPVKMLYLAFEGNSLVDESTTPAYMRSLPDRRCEFLARWMLEAGDVPTRDLMLQLLVNHYLQAGDDEPILAIVKRFIREHLSDPITLADLAAVAGVSPFHFARRFRAATGIPPMQYVRRQRIEAARAMLLTSPMPLRAIAPVVGFRDEFELSRVFKRETGASPRQIRPN